MLLVPARMQLFVLVAASLVATALAAGHEHPLPSYHYGTPIQVECMNRSSYVELPFYLTLTPH